MDENNDHFPEKIQHKTYACFSTIAPLSPKQMSYTDQTGRFPYQSSSGTSYVYILYNYDSNAILLHPLQMLVYSFV